MMQIIITTEGINVNADMCLYAWLMAKLLFNIVVYNMSLCCAGCRNATMGKVLKDIFQAPYFRIFVVPDEETVEVCGALKVHSHI